MGADVATMVGSLSVLVAVVVWCQHQRRDWRVRRAERRLRNWHGYIALGGIASWHVRVVETQAPAEPTACVVLEVVDGKGKPAIGRADALRQQVKRDKMLARVPTPTEHQFLGDLQKDHGYGQDPSAVVVR